jgi:hypothetical protein
MFVAADPVDAGEEMADVIVFVEADEVSAEDSFENFVSPGEVSYQLE